MNSLSWLIYFADIVSNIQGVLVTLAILFGAGYIVSLIVAVLEGLKRPKHWFVTVAIVLGFCAAILPSSKTVYAIAASELGEQVLVSNTGKKAVAALEAWLDAQVKGLK